MEPTFLAASRKTGQKSDTFLAGGLQSVRAVVDTAHDGTRA